jgi:hypothetical protein
MTLIRFNIANTHNQFGYPTEGYAVKIKDYFYANVPDWSLGNGFSLQINSECGTVSVLANNLEIVEDPKIKQILQL